MECLRCVLFVELKIFTKSWKPKFPEILGTEDTILYAAAFDANGGVFEPLLPKKIVLFLMNSITFLL